MYLFLINCPTYRIAIYAYLKGFVKFIILKFLSVYISNIIKTFKSVISRPFDVRKLKKINFL